MMTLEVKTKTVTDLKMVNLKRATSVKKVTNLVAKMMTKI